MALSFQNKDQFLNFLDISMSRVLGNKMKPNLLHLIVKFITFNCVS